MIYDKLTNIGLYATIPEDVRDFIVNLSPDIKLGRVELSNGNYANVEQYTTKPINEAKFESHKNYIDIQILLSGNERIFVTDSSDLSVLTPYNSERDIIFYSDEVKDYPFVALNGTNFVVLPPGEAHAPQVSSGDICEEVLKVVVKIKV